MVTLHSFDLDWPGLTPWFWPAKPTVYNRLAPLTAHPAGDTLAFPVLAAPPGTVHPDSEFAADGRAAAPVTGLRSACGVACRWAWMMIWIRQEDLALSQQKLAEDWEEVPDDWEAGGCPSCEAK
ncbi:MAG: hypothetical protein L0Z62_45280 [Gemmataceae bacterium]|nr:hypothetical protein [Gemmataceae bacterium]